jgi:hypothetical protein
LASAAALTFGVGSALAGGSHQRAGSGATCKYSLTDSSATGSGTGSGTVKCSKPAGKGTAKTSYTITGNALFGYTMTGTFKDKFKHHKGSLSGSFKISTQLLSSTSWKGTFTIKKGTRKLSKAKGSGTETCTSSGMHFSCTDSGGKL